MKKITKGVFFIPGRDDFIPDSHVYVIGEPDSHDLTIVDAGLMGKGGYKIDSIRSGTMALDDIKRVIMTHTHLDHIGCLAEILDAVPHAELWIHSNEAVPLEQGDERTVYGMDMLKEACQSQYNLKAGDFAFKANRRLEGGEVLEIGGMVWDVIHIPGHSSGSIALYNPQGKILIPGDVVYADFAIGRFDLHQANGRDLKKSLDRLAELDVAVLLPGHNNIDTELAPGYIQRTAEHWGPYLL